MRRRMIIKYNDKKYVGGYSLKTDKVWFVPQPEQAYVFTDVKANDFIRDHANKGRGFKFEFITLEILPPRINKAKKLLCKTI